MAWICLDVAMELVARSCTLLLAAVHDRGKERFPTVQSLFGPYGDKGAITNSVNTRSLSSTAIKNPPLLDLFYTGTMRHHEASGTMATVTHKQGIRQLN
jgi:hypothetical protein